MGLVRYAGDWRVIIFSYFCALLPLAIIYALDFITTTWKSVRRTRRDGMLHLVCSLPPLGVVIFYIHLQRIAKDYKEMATAITAAILCIFHILRTVWGLIQLRAFKKWCMHAFQVLSRTGFDVPVYVALPNAPNASKAVATKKRTVTLPNAPNASKAFATKKRTVTTSEETNDTPTDNASSGISIAGEGKIRSPLFFRSGAISPSESEEIRFVCHQNSIRTDDTSRSNITIGTDGTNRNDITSGTDNTISGTKVSGTGERTVESSLGSESLSILVDNINRRNASTANAESEGELKNESLRIRILRLYSTITGLIRKAFGTEKIEIVHLSELSRIHLTGRNMPKLTAQEIERTVDYRMVVNSSLVDNEFRGADLPCRLTGFYRLRSKKPEECTIQWTVAFLSRFGPEWLVSTNMLANFERGSASEHLSSGLQFPNRLAAFAAFSVTQRLEIELKDGQDVSFLSPLHVMCSDLIEPWTSTLKVTHSNALPYHFRGGSSRKVLKFEEYATSIRNGASAWSKECLNELDQEQKDAVSNMSPHQVACFLKLMEEQNSHVLHTYSGSTYFSERTADKQRINIFLWQLGFISDPIEGCFKEEEVSSTLFDSLPVLTESLRVPFWHGAPSLHHCTIPQASVHADNWMALENEVMPFSSKDARSELSEAESGQCRRVFSSQKRIELRRLHLEVAAAEGSDICDTRKIKFLGCVMEFVRSSLARWVHNSGSEDVDWNPPIPNACCPVFCSDQLIDALQEADVADCGRENESEIAQTDTQRNSLHLRILWEIQLNLVRSDIHSISPDSLQLMILCILGYPSLHISKINNIHVQSSCYKIGVAEAPQQLHIIFQWDSVSTKASVQLLSNEGHDVAQFCWQSWKHGFMGRICAQSEWRSKCLHVKGEKILEEAVVSAVSGCVRRNCEMTYWTGWPPFRTAIAQFEGQDSPKLDEETDKFPRTQVEEVTLADEVQDDVASPEIACDCVCELFLQANELAKNGEEMKAFELFGCCIMDHGHALSLKHCVAHVSKDLPKNEGLVKKLLSFIYPGIQRASEEVTTKVCSKLTRYNLGQVIKLAGEVYDKSLDARAFHLKGVALLFGIQKDGAGDEQCIEAFESYLVLQRGSAPLALGMSHFCLALCYLRRYCCTGHIADSEIGMQHFIRISDRYLPERHHWTMDIALLFERGSYSKREYSKVRALRGSSDLLPEGIDLERILRSVFLWSSNISHRISKNSKAAFTIYSKLASACKKSLRRSDVEPRLFNRLALMYHTGADDVAKNLPEAERLYALAIRVTNLWVNPELDHIVVYKFNAMCNLAVLYGQREDNQENAAMSVKLFRNAIKELKEMEGSVRRSYESSCDGGVPKPNTYESSSDEGVPKPNISKSSSDDGPVFKHSTSMNNLAVLRESGKLITRDVEKAKQLYWTSIRIDGNPIAMYNLGLLLKFEDATPQNLLTADDLFSKVQALGEDLQSMPVLNAQLETARDRDPSEISSIFDFRLEEIDDCLAYVKIVDNNL